MKITTISSREFNQDTSRAKKAAREGPVFITDRGIPAAGPAGRQQSIYRHLVVAACPHIRRPHRPRG